MLHLLHQCLHYQAYEVDTEIASNQLGSHLLKLLKAFHRTSVHVQGPGSGGLRTQRSILAGVMYSGTFLGISRGVKSNNLRSKIRF